MKGKEEVISEFNILTNMSVDELDEWLKDPQSKKAGTGVGLESAKKIMGILKKNPTKDPEKYDEVGGYRIYSSSYTFITIMCRRTSSICAKSSRERSSGYAQLVGPS